MSFRQLKPATVLDTAAKRRAWRTALRALRVLCETRLPVRVYIGRFPNDDDFGEWEGRDGSHIIRLDASLFERDPGLYFAREVLAHEWAHALCGEAGHRRESNDHTPRWGICYSEAYLAVFDRNE